MTADEFETALTDMETRVDRLRALYENWFRGYEKSEPSVARKEVERRVYALRKELPRNTALRFRYHQLYLRYTTLANYWQRTARQIEEGTYKLQLRRMQRRNERVRDKTGEPGEEGSEQERERPLSYELNLDESLNVADLLDELELDEVARALHEPGPYNESKPAQAQPPAGSGRAAAESPGKGRASVAVPAASVPQTGTLAGVGRPLPAAATAPSAPQPPLPGQPNTPPAARAPATGMPGANSPPGKPLPAAPITASKPGLPPPALPTKPGVPAPAPPLPAATPKPGVPPLPPLPAKPAKPPPAVPSIKAPSAAVPAEPDTVLPRSAPAAARPAPTQPGAAQGGAVQPGAGRPAAAQPTPGAARPAAPAAATPPLRPAQPAARAPVSTGNTFVGRPPLSSPLAGPAAPDEQRLRRIYDEYAAARRRNNEGEVRYEAWVGSIQKMMPELTKKHQGKRIDFEVVVKDGRVGLKPKAT